MIERYQRAIPNGGERLLALAEGEAEHRRKMEKRQLTFNFVAHLNGQILGAVIAIFVIAAGAWLIDHGHNVSGFATLLVGAGGLISAALRGRRQNGE